MQLKYVVVIAVICVILGYIAHRPKEKVITKTVTTVEYKDRIINKDTVIERKIYVATNGTVVTEEKEIIKDKIVEKEVIKEKEVLKEVPIDKQWLVSLEYIHLNHEYDIQKLFVAKQILPNLYIGLGTYMRMDLFQEDYTPKYNWQNISIGVTYLF